MKNIAVLVLCLIAFSLTAQRQETLFSKGSKYGAFGSPIIEVSNINGETVGGFGGGGALIMDDFFLGGYGVGTDGSKITINQVSHDIDFSHGGLWLGYAFPSRKLVHGYASFRIGWGDVNLKEIDGDKKFSDNHMTMSPELGVELNFVSWARVAFTGGYRIVNGLTNLPGGLNDETFQGGYGAITFRFGAFGYYGHRNLKIQID